MLLKWQIHMNLHFFFEIESLGEQLQSLKSISDLLSCHNEKVKTLLILKWIGGFSF